MLALRNFSFASLTFKKRENLRVEPSKKIVAKIISDDFAFEGAKDAEHYAAMKSGSIQARRPTVQARARKLGDGTFLIVYENVPKVQGDSETRTVFDLLIQKPGNPKEGVLLTLGVPASQMDRGFRLLALLKQSVQITW